MANHHILATLEYVNYHILATKSRRHKSHLQQMKYQFRFIAPFQHISQLFYRTF